MDRYTEHKCPWGCSLAFSEAQSVRDKIQVKEGGKYVSKKVIQCPGCGGKVKHHKNGWIKGR